MSNVKAKVYAELFQAAVEATLATAEKIPESSRMRQAQDGKAHPVWLVGHLTYALDLVVNQWTLGGESCCPEEYTAMFSPAFVGGKPISAHASDFPPWDELVEYYRKAGGHAVELIGDLVDSELSGELKGPVPEASKSFFGNLEQTLRAMSAHDSHHRGQMCLLAALA